MTEENRNLFPAEPPEAPEPAPRLEEITTTSQAETEGTPVVGQVPPRPGRTLPDDLRVPWDWLDLLLFGLFAVGATIVFGALVAMALALLHVSPAKVKESPGIWSLVNVAAQVVLDLGLLAYLAAQVRVRFHSPFWKTIGWHRLDTGTSPRALTYFMLVLGGSVLAVLTLAAEAVFPRKQALPIQTVLQDPRSALLFMLTAVFIAPLVEETLFRGYLYPVVARSFGIGTGVVLTGTLFGLLHSVQLWGGWWQIALLVVVGIVFTLARAKTGTVLASYILHLSYNSLQVITTMIATHGLRHMPPVR